MSFLHKSNFFLFELSAFILELIYALSSACLMGFRLKTAKLKGIPQITFKVYGTLSNNAALQQRPPLKEPSVLRHQTRLRLYEISSA